jgi:hypothetical protein
MDQFTVHRLSKSVCTTGRYVAGYVPIFTPSTTIRAIYLYIKFSDRFMAYAVRLLLLMNAKK